MCMTRRWKLTGQTVAIPRSARITLLHDSGHKIKATIFDFDQLQQQSFNLILTYHPTFDTL